jgi:hypothetical protein
MPLDIALLVLQCAGPNFEQPHTHSRSDFCKFHGLVASLDKHVVADFDGVFDIFESALHVSVNHAFVSKGCRRLT